MSGRQLMDYQARRPTWERVATAVERETTILWASDPKPLLYVGWTAQWSPGKGLHGAAWFPNADNPEDGYPAVLTHQLTDDELRLWEGDCFAAWVSGLRTGQRQQR